MRGGGPAGSGGGLDGSWIRGWATVFELILGGGPHGFFCKERGWATHIFFTLK